MSYYLTAEQLAEYAKRMMEDPSYHVDTPPGETPICAYCGKETTAQAYTCRGVSYPACCSSPECLDKWEPVKRP